jgi:hypothetical protein
MYSNAVEIARLERRMAWLRMIRRVNLGLAIVLLIFVLVMWLVLPGTGDLDSPHAGNRIHAFSRCARIGCIGAVLNLALLLRWGPAMIVYSFKLKRLKEAERTKAN